MYDCTSTGMELSSVYVYENIQRFEKWYMHRLIQIHTYERLLILILLGKLEFILDC